MKIQIIISTEDGEILDRETVDVSTQHLALLEVEDGCINPKSIADFNIGETNGR